MNRPHFCILISVTCFSMAIAAPVQNEDMDIREPLDRYYTAVARIARDAEKRNQTEVRRLTVALKNALNAATRAEDDDRVADIKVKLDQYQTIGDPAAFARSERVSFGGHTYALIEGNLTWHAAKHRCEAMGGHLVCVETQEEDEFIGRFCNGNVVWIGGTDELVEGEWRWVTGDRMDYRNAVFDNHEGAQHHAIYWPSLGRWDDQFAGVRLDFICEWIE
jgi:hypothetical protein